MVKNLQILNKTIACFNAYQSINSIIVLNIRINKQIWKLKTKGRKILF